MARSEARIFVTIWQDHDFIALTDRAQRLYLLALSQPHLSFCGVLSFTTKRWSKLASNTSVDDVQNAVDELVAARFVILDEDTEELWIRSFVRHDGVLRSPNLAVAMGKDFVTIQSATIHDAFLDELPDEFPDLTPSGMTEAQRKGLPDELRNPLRKGSGKGSGNPLRRVRGRARAAPSPLPLAPSPAPTGERAANGSGNGSGKGSEANTSPPSVAPLVSYFVDQCQTNGWQPTTRVRGHVGREVKRLLAEDQVPDEDLRAVLRCVARERKSPASFDLVLADLQHERNTGG